MGDPRYGPESGTGIPGVHRMKEKHKQVGEKRRHHHTPLFYLAGFTAAGRKDDYLNVLSIEDGKWWQSKPDNIGLIRDFYGINVKGLAHNEVEDYLSMVEANAAPVAKRLVDSGELPKDQDRAELLDFVTLQAMRGPSARNRIEELCSKIGRLLAQQAMIDRASVETLLAEAKKEEFPLPKGACRTELQRLTYEDLVELAHSDRYTVSVPKNYLVFAILLLAKDLYPRFWNRQWSLLIAPESKTHFICSDNPVTLVSKYPVPRGAELGFAMANTEVLFPLSKGAALVGTFEGEPHTRKVDKSIVAEANRRIGTQAHSQVYSPAQDFLCLRRDKSVGNAQDLLVALRNR